MLGGVTSLERRVMALLCVVAAGLAPQAAVNVNQMNQLAALQAQAAAAQSRPAPATIDPRIQVRGHRAVPTWCPSDHGTA